MERWIARQIINRLFEVRMEKVAFHQSTNEKRGGCESLDKSLLVVDDDRLFCDRLARALSSRGFTGRTAMSMARRYFKWVNWPGRHRR